MASSLSLKTTTGPVDMTSHNSYVNERNFHVRKWNITHTSWWLLMMTGIQYCNLLNYPLKRSAPAPFRSIPTVFSKLKYCIPVAKTGKLKCPPGLYCNSKKVICHSTVLDYLNIKYILQSSATLFTHNVEIKLLK